MPDPITTATDSGSRMIVAKGRWRFCLGVSEATDEGWRHKGGPIHRFGVSNLSVPQARGFGVTLGRWLVWVFIKRDGVE